VLALTTIKWDESEIIVAASKSNDDSWTTKIPWVDIEKIVVYKRDVFAYDLICLFVDFKGNEIELNEEMDGWDSLLETLPLKLPGALVREDWWEKVAFPPFATNPTLIFILQCK